MRRGMAIAVEIVFILLLAITITACNGGSGESPTSHVTSMGPSPIPSPTSKPTPTLISGDKPVLTIAVIPEGGGTTNLGEGAYVQRLGSVLEIRAIPLYGYEFIGWTGEVTDATAETTYVTMNEDKTVTANFREVGTPQPPPTKLPNPCEWDRDTIQAALDKYHEVNGTWPTSDGQPGDIVWEKLVPDFMASMPALDKQCEWQVNSNPEGQVCVMTPC